MKFEACKDPAIPPDSALAIRSPQGDFHGYESLIITHCNYWKRQEPKARDEAKNDYKKKFAKRIQGILGGETYDPKLQIAAYFKGKSSPDPEKLRIAEVLRQRLLAGMAMSILVRRLLRPGPEANQVADALEYGWTNAFIEMNDDPEDRTSIPLPDDYRMHIAPDFIQDTVSISLKKATPQEGRWYRSNNQISPLYVRCFNPPKPSVEGITNVWAQNVEVDLTTLVTVEPFLASRPQD